MLKAKKCIGLLMALVLLMAFVPAVGAEEGFVLVYAQVPEDWSNPCVWTWDAEGNNGFEGAAWPGVPMTADESNPGWYYLYIPDTMKNIILNANEGTVQTSDYAIEAKDMWISVAADLQATISYEKATQGDAPAYVAYVKPSKPLLTAEDVILVYAQTPEDWSNPCVWTWDADGKGAFDAWPGGKLTADENNPGWSWIFIPKTMANVIVNANEGGVQTKDCAIEAKNMWLQVVPAAAEGENSELTVSYEQLTQGELPQFTATVKAFAQVPEDWNAPCVWAWNKDGVNAFEAWPGKEMEKQADGWYMLEIPASMENIIVNANGGTVQTKDYAIEAGKDVYVAVTDAETVEITYEKPAEPTFLVHAMVDESWVAPCLWSWSHPDGTNVFVNWPGQELNDEGNGWYSYGLPLWVNRVIINANAGSVQTADIEIEAKELWLKVAADKSYTLYYEEPAVEAEAPAEPAQEPATEEVQEPAVEEPATEPAEETKSPVVGIVIAVVAVAAIAVAAVIIGKKKKA